MVSALCEGGADVNAKSTVRNFTMRARRDAGALHQAVLDGEDVEMVQILIDAKADVLQKTAILNEAKEMNPVLKLIQAAVKNDLEPRIRRDLESVAMLWSEILSACLAIPTVESILESHCVDNHV
uniref:Uncharacterized protein n=1 Tax=Lotharella globosa TaxID=91324 RepID=A0A7S3Z929_9EUKA